MKTPQIYQLQEMFNMCIKQTYKNGKWVAKRPDNNVSIVTRIKAAWVVFTGKADAVVWPENQ